MRKQSLELTSPQIDLQIKLHLLKTFTSLITIVKFAAFLFRKVLALKCNVSLYFLSSRATGSVFDVTLLSLCVTFVTL